MGLICELIDDIFCYFGIHDWIYYHGEVCSGPVRQCSNCERTEAYSQFDERWHEI